MKVAVLGTGRMGSGLARLWAMAGEDVFIGSRDPAKAQALVSEIKKVHPAARVVGSDNATAAKAAEVVVPAVPYKQVAPFLRKLKPSLKGKIVIDISNPLKPDYSGLTTKPSTSGAEEIGKVTGKAIPLVGAFKNTFSALLGDPGLPQLHPDVLVCGDDEKAKSAVMRLVERIGFRALDAGKLRTARTIEHMTVLMVALDVRYKAGFKSGWQFLD
jgi:hypothetical protein